MRSGQCMELVTGGSDMWIFIVFVCVTVTAIIIFVNYRRTKKTMDTIEEMLNVAVKGEFTEGQFDETRMSALETKFAHYLSASALSAQNVEAEKNKIKALIADISHQTKTPIANLLLYSELLLEEELPQQIEGNVSAIHEQTQKLKFLIESLVKLSRLENGILQLVPRMEKLQPMLERAVWELKQKAEELGLTNTHFENCTGLHNDNHYSTCRDIAVLMSECLKSDTFREIVTREVYTTEATASHPEGITLYDTMLHRFTSYEMSTTLENGAVIEGGKTGFTDEAGQCLVSFAEYGGEEYILVTAEAMTDSGSAVDSIADASTVYGRLQ